MIQWYDGNPLPSRLTVIEKALSTAEGGVSYLPESNLQLGFQQRSFQYSIVLVCNTKPPWEKLASIRDQSWQQGNQPPVPSEIQEWQESFVSDGLFASASEFPLMFSQYSRSQVFLHIKFNTVCRFGTITHFHIQTNGSIPNHIIELALLVFRLTLHFLKF